MIAHADVISKTPLHLELGRGRSGEGVRDTNKRISMWIANVMTKPIRMSLQNRSLH